jgi:hypothetical protein
MGDPCVLWCVHTHTSSCVCLRRQVFAASVTRASDPAIPAWDPIHDLYVFEVRGTGFLWHQVRPGTAQGVCGGGRGFDFA